MMDSTASLQGDEQPGLFQRLPDTLFRPLASQNRQLYWDLLLHLYEQFFGPDAPPAPDDGYLSRTVSIDVERFVSTREWFTPEGEVQVEDTPTAKAGYLLRSLIDAGWLTEERIGVRNFLDMRPTVQKFLELIKQFAEEGPQFIGGKVQLIYNQLLAVQADPASQAVGFHESAKEARALISMLKATNMRVREAMDLLSTHESTADFVRAFFTDYISNLYIRDYHELRTENHPLRHRYEILQVVYELRDQGPAREALVSWYHSAFKTTSREQAESLFERDVGRFLVFGQIEDHLDRLNNSVSRTTRRALSYIQYKIRTRDRLDRLIDQSLKAFEFADREQVPLYMPFAMGPLFAEGALRPPKVAPAPVQRSPIRTPVMSPEMRALNELRKIVTKNREVSAPEVLAYLEAQVPRGKIVSSKELKISSIKELCLFAALARLTLASTVTPPSRHKHVPLLAALERRGIRLARVPGEFTENDYLIAPTFEVRR
jgi:hypothetical protein